MDSSIQNKEAMQKVVQSMLNTAQCLEVVDLLESAGIRVMVLKGCILSQYLYGDPAIRYSTDVDLLVREEDLERAHETLIHSDYNPLDAIYFSNKKRLRAAKKIYLHSNYISPDGRTVIELHWKPFLGGDLSAVWEKTIRITLADRHIETMSPVNTFIYLSMHGCRHKWSREQWLDDVAAMLRNKQVTIEEIWEKSINDKLQRPVAIALLLLKDKRGIELPQVVVNECEKDPNILKLLNCLNAEEGTGLPDWLKPIVKGIRDNMYYLRIVPTIRYKMAVLGTLTTTSLDWETVDLSGRLFPFYYLLRPFCWAKRKILGSGC